MAYHYYDVTLVTTDGNQQLGTLNAFPTGSYIGSASAFKNAYAYNNGLFDLTSIVNSVSLGSSLNQKVVTLSNGNYFSVVIDRSRPTQYGGYYISDSFRLCDSNDNVLFSWGRSTSARTGPEYLYDICLVLLAFDDSTNNCLSCWHYKTQEMSYVYSTASATSTPKTVFDEWITGSVKPDYSWSAWNQIAGNGGQYRCNLTMVKDESIGDFSGLIYGDSDDMDRISSQADLMNIFHNMSYDTERIIGWSGSNWVSLTLHAVTGLPNQVEFYFKFYIPGVSSVAPIYSQSFNVVWNGEFRAQAFYMSFVHDDEQQAALFAPVEKMYNGQFNWGYNASAITSDDMLYLWLWLQASGSPQGDSPYSTGTTDNGGEPGGGMPQSHIDVPGAPQLGGTATGMFTVYCPTELQMRKIASFLWSANTIDNIRKYFNNFAENIIAFYALPCKPSNNPTKIFTVGNMSSDDSDLQSVEYISNRFLQIDMGDLVISPFWDSYLDYAPYSKMEIYLPGIGVQPVDVDDIMCPALEDGSLPEAKGSRLHIDYTVDLMTGVLVAFLSINGEMRYQFPGKIGYSIPLTGENYSRLVQGYVTATAGLIGTIATGGTAAPFAAGAAAAGIINAMKPDIYRGGNLSGDASMLSRKTPMLIYRRPNKPQLDNQEEFTGFPSYKIGLLSEFSGYTEVIDAHVEGISCTDEERELILNALKEGVII